MAGNDLQVGVVQTLRSLDCSNGYDAPTEAQMRIFYNVRRVLHDDEANFKNVKTLTVKPKKHRRKLLKAKIQSYKQNLGKIVTFGSKLDVTDIFFLYRSYAKIACNGKSVFNRKSILEIVAWNQPKCTNLNIIKVIDSLSPNNICIFADLVHTCDRIKKINWIEDSQDNLIIELFATVLYNFVDCQIKNPESEEAVAVKKLSQYLAKMYCKTKATQTISEILKGNVQSFRFELFPHLEAYHSVEEMIRARQLCLLDDFFQTAGSNASVVNELAASARSGRLTRRNFTVSTSALDPNDISELYKLLAKQHCMSGIIPFKFISQLLKWSLAQNEDSRPHKIPDSASLKEILNRLPVLNRLILSDLTHILFALLDTNAGYNRARNGMATAAAIVAKMLMPGLKKDYSATGRVQEFHELERKLSNALGFMFEALIKTDLADAIEQPESFTYSPK